MINRINHSISVHFPMCSNLFQRTGHTSPSLYCLLGTLDWIYRTLRLVIDRQVKKFVSTIWGWCSSKSRILLFYHLLSFFGRLLQRCFKSSWSFQVLSWQQLLRPVPSPARSACRQKGWHSPTWQMPSIGRPRRCKIYGSFMDHIHALGRQICICIKPFSVAICCW